MTPAIRRAERRDLPRVEALFKQAELAPLETQPSLSNVLVAEEERKLLGAVALEVIGRSGWVHALAVAPERRREGLGRELLRSLMARAHELGLRELYALAGPAEEFLRAVGFEAVEDEELSASVRHHRPLRRRIPERGPLLALSLG